MIVYAAFNYDDGFFGLFADPSLDKNLSREFVDVVICEGEENSCDVIADKASSGFEWRFINIMNFFGWELKPELSRKSEDNIIYHAFKEFK